MMIVSYCLSVCCDDSLLLFCVGSGSKDVPRRGVAFAASAVLRQFYTGCVENEMTS